MNASPLSPRFPSTLFPTARRGPSSIRRCGNLPALPRTLARTLAIVAGLLAILTSISPAEAQSVDRVRRRNGVDSGKIIAITPLGVTVSRGGVENTVPAEEIVSIAFAGEPQPLSSARTAAVAGRFDEALKLLAEIPPATLRREEMAADADYYRVLSAARLAINGQGDLPQASNDIKDFLKARRTSFHVPDAIELLGDLFAAQQQYGSARSQYGLLARAKSVYYETRSQLLVGQTYQAEKNHAAAVREFDKVIAAADKSPPLETLRLNARLARAISRSAAGETEEATREVGEIIAATDTGEEELLAQAYLALGDCYLSSGDSKGALFALLHVELLFSNVSQAHAQALEKLVDLWQELGYPDRAREASEQLSQRYR